MSISEEKKELVRILFESSFVKYCIFYILLSTEVKLTGQIPISAYLQISNILLTYTRSEYKLWSPSEIWKEKEELCKK